MLPADLMPGIQNTAFSQKDGIQPKSATTNLSTLMLDGPPCCIVYRDMPLEQSNNYWLDKLMCEIIMTLINHHMLILSTARQHCVRTLIGFLSTECGCDCHAVVNRKFKISQ